MQVELFVTLDRITILLNTIHHCLIFRLGVLPRPTEHWVSCVGPALVAFVSFKRRPHEQFFASNGDAIFFFFLQYTQQNYSILIGREQYN